MSTAAPGLPGLASSPPDKIVAITEYRNRIFVATERGVYELIDGIWCHMAFHGEGERDANSAAI